jgi:uncharacterized protein YoxC
MSAVGQLVSLEEYRSGKIRGLSAISRLERSVGRLEASVRRTAGRMTPTVERELLLIVRAVSSGRAQEAARRAERLAGLLEHPATLPT